MRNLKRALSLALASVMVVSMMVVGAGAASYDDFSDKDEIVNQEAVQMLVELGVINGKDTGDFDPTGIVTRAEMAKMICVVLNGGKDPSLGTTVTNTYTDTVNHWASGYIEYCTQLGIVAGDGTGKFNPDATVTGSEAAKMLLVALGYKSEVEGFTGANWSIAVNVRANQKELYSDLSISVDEGLTRDDAAQMIYNALDAGVVTYDYTLVSDGSTISSSPTLIDDNDKTLLEDKFNAVKVEGVVLANEHANLESSSEKGASLDSGKTTLLVTNYDDQEYYGNSASTKSETFAISTELEDLGRSVVVYVKKNSNASKAEVLGSAITSSDNKVVVDASTDSIADVADDNKLDLDYSVTQVATNYKGLTDLTSTLANYDSTAGVEKVLIDTDDDGTVDYVLMNTWFFGKVTSYSASGDGSIVVDVGATQTTDVLSKTVTKLTADDADDVVGFEDVAKDDYVLAAYIGGDLHVVVADSVTGTMDSYKDTAPTTKVTVDGTEYNVSNVTGYVGGDDDIRKVADEAADSVKNEATFYLDQNGYVVAMGEAEENAGKYAMVLAVGSDISDQVKVALADGTVATYDINDNGVKKNALVIGQVYAYSINSNDEIKLTKVDIAKQEQASAGFEKGKITIKAGATTLGYATSSTAFFYVSDTDGQIIGQSSSISGDDVSTYTSYTTAPDVDSSATVTTYTKTLSDGTTRIVAVVFAGDKLVSADVDDNLYVTKIISTDGDDTTVNAFVSGSDELQTIVVSGTDVALRHTYTYSLNADGTYDLGTDYTQSGVSVTSVTGNNFVVTGGQAYTITSDTLVVDHSTYLDSATATLGTSATISKGDNIIGLIANSEDEALMVVVRNSTSSDNTTSTYDTTVTVSNGTVTVKYYGTTAPTANEIAALMGNISGISNISVNGNNITFTQGGISYTVDVTTSGVRTPVYKVTYNGKEIGFLANGETVTVTDQSKSTLLKATNAAATTFATATASGTTYTVASGDAIGSKDITLVDGYSYTDSVGTVTPVDVTAVSGSGVKYVPAGTVLKIAASAADNTVTATYGTTTVTVVTGTNAVEFEMPAANVTLKESQGATFVLEKDSSMTAPDASYADGVYTAQNGDKFDVTITPATGSAGTEVTITVTPQRATSATLTIADSGSYSKTLSWTNGTNAQTIYYTLVAGQNKLTIKDGYSYSPATQAKVEFTTSSNITGSAQMGDTLTLTLDGETYTWNYTDESDADAALTALAAQVTGKGWTATYSSGTFTCTKDEPGKTTLTGSAQTITGTFAGSSITTVDATSGVTDGTDASVS